MIVEHGLHSLGLLVDALHGVPEFSEQQLSASPFGNGDDGRLVSHFIQAQGGRLLVQLLDVQQLFRRLIGETALAA